MKKKDLIPVEATFLTTLIWLDKRLRIVDYLELLETLYYRVNLQMPESRIEQHNLDNKFWYWYPLCILGLFLALAYVAATMSGALLGSYYSPVTTGDPTTAYNSIKLIMRDLQFGFILRSVHRWAAQVVVAVVFLHMLCIYFTRSYKKPHELSWLLGIVLISLTMVLGYTGYLLSWDQLAFWAG